MALMIGGTFSKKYFVEGSRPTNEKLVPLIIDGVFEGKVLNGVPYVDEDWWLASGRVLNSVSKMPKSTFNDQALELLK